MAGDPSRQQRPDKGGRKPAKGNAHGPSKPGSKKPAPISQSDTKWVKEPGKKGYVVQISTGKRVTGKVAVVKAGSTKANKRGVASYAKGRNVTGAKPKPAARPAARPAANPQTGPTGGGLKEGQTRTGAKGAKWKVVGGKWVKTAHGPGYETPAKPVVRPYGNTTVANQNQVPAAKPKPKPSPAFTPPGNRPSASSGTAKEGDRRVGQNAAGERINMVYRNGRWVAA